MNPARDSIPETKVQIPIDTDFWLAPFLEDKFSDTEDAWRQLFEWPGETIRHVKNRHTLKIEIDGNNYYIKRHLGVGWKEIFKNLIQGKMPVLGARNEYEGTHAMQEAGIQTLKLVGYGEKGINPAQHQSFIITEELKGWVKLSQIKQVFDQLTPDVAKRFRLRLIRDLADTTRRMHRAGLNHRDYYLCHVLIKDRDWTTITGDEKNHMLVVDLHRMQRRERTPKRWIQKDLAGILFSSAHLKLTKKECIYFIRQYTQEKNIARLYREDPAFWNKINQRAIQLLKKRKESHYRLPFEMKSLAIAWFISGLCLTSFKMP